MKNFILASVLVVCLQSSFGSAQRADGQPEMPKPPGMCDAEDALTKDPKGE